MPYIGPVDSHNGSGMLPPWPDFRTQFLRDPEADFSVRELRFVSDNVLMQNLKLFGRTWDQVRLFFESVESVKDLRYERLAGVIAVDPGYLNVGFAK